MKRLFLLLSVMFLFIGCQTLSKKDDSFDVSRLYEFVYDNGSKGYVYLADTLNGVYANCSKTFYYDGKKLYSHNNKDNNYECINSRYFIITHYTENLKNGKWEESKLFDLSYPYEDVVRCLMDNEFYINPNYICIWD